ncbi:MAG: Rpn family recombination-promoting nuclease/putative transposase [Paludibacteraceae bacterium]|nr:Rpn family recombination-promoting nuclease/putative transposase [Paludibacteraceae bacterium]
MKEKYIRFDWAIKRILRDKANFDVLEGLLTVLIGEKILIKEILESESNQDSYDDKFNRVDIKALNSKNEIIIVEVQLSREVHFLERILYGVSKTICEHISLGNDYDKIKKVYSISILYFDLGHGSDYLYYGKTDFKGVHTKDTLQITKREKEAMLPTKDKSMGSKADASSIFPEYYLIRVNEFNDYATTPIEEWMAYLKDGVIKEDTTTPGLQAAKEKLNFMGMNVQDRLAYERHLDNLRILNDVIYTAKLDGLEEGRAEGFAKGIEQERYSNAKKMKEAGIDDTVISKISGLSLETVKKL